LELQSVGKLYTPLELVDYLGKTNVWGAIGSGLEAIVIKRVLGYLRVINLWLS
jgi:hypothetical protein